MSKKTSLERQEKRYGERRRSIKRLLAIALLATLAAVVFGFWASRRHRGGRNVTAELPGNVTRRLSGFNYTRTEKGRPVFTIHATRTLAYAAAHTVLEGVRVTIYSPDGKPGAQISTSRCQYENGTGELACTGEATLELRTSGTESRQNGDAANPLTAGQPLILKTSNVRYDHLSSAVETPDQVSFTLGSVRGSARGLDYNISAGHLALQRDVSFVLPQAGALPGPIRLSAGGLAYSRRTNQIALDAPVRLSADGASLDASSGVIKLDSKNRLSGASFSGARVADTTAAYALSGDANTLVVQFDPHTRQARSVLATGRAEARASGPTGVRELTAESVAVTFAAAAQGGSALQRQHQFVQFARAKGNAKLVFDFRTKHTSPAQANPLAVSGERVLTAPEIFLAFRDGNVPDKARTAGPSELRLTPENTRLDRQTVSANGFDMQFNKLGRLKAIRGFSPTRVVDEPQGASTRARRVSSADNLEARFDAATGEIAQLRQSGHFEFREGTNQARAAEAVADPLSGRLALSGSPELSNAQGRIRAAHVLIHQKSGVAVAWGGVQSVRYPEAAGQEHAAEAKGDPLIVTAQRLTVDRGKQTASYAGDVRAWSGADVVEAPKIEIDWKSARVTATGGVLTSLPQPAGRAPHPSSAAPARTAISPRVTIRADKLTYLDSSREAIYQGSVRMVASNTTFRSRLLEVFFSGSPGGGNPQIERAVAEGGVIIAQSPGRRATGARAEFTASSGSIVLTGGPPAVYDQNEGYLTGKRLTFSIRDASLFADGETHSQSLARHRVTKR